MVLGKVSNYTIDAGTIDTVNRNIYLDDNWSNFFFRDDRDAPCVEQLLNEDGNRACSSSFGSCNDTLEEDKLQNRPQSSHYPTRIPGTNDGTYISELSIYKDIMTYEKETNRILYKLDQLADKEDEFC